MTSKRSQEGRIEVNETDFKMKSEKGDAFGLRFWRSGLRFDFVRQECLRGGFGSGAVAVYQSISIPVGSISEYQNLR